MHAALRRLSVGRACLAMAVVAGCHSSSRGGASPDSTAEAPSVVDSGAPRPSSVTRTDSVVLRTDKAQYRPGEKMTLTFENRSAATYAFNPCTRSIEREEASAWIALPDEGRMCTMEAWILDPHGTRSGPTELPASMSAGRYRVVVRMTVEGGGVPASPVTAISDPIRVG